MTPSWGDAEKFATKCLETPHLTSVDKSDLADLDRLLRKIGKIMEFYCEEVGK
jgi:hypothetical protein